jgi:hypothetical protein
MLLSPPTFVETLSVCSRRIRLSGQVKGAIVEVVGGGGRAIRLRQHKVHHANQWNAKILAVLWINQRCLDRWPSKPRKVSQRYW